MKEYTLQANTSGTRTIEVEISESKELFKHSEEFG